MSPRLRCKGCFVSKSQLNKLRMVSETGKDNAERKAIVESLKKPKSSNVCVGQANGDQIVSLSHLGQMMKCSSCTVYSSFENIINGLASKPTIKCHNCLLLNKVSTPNKYKNAKEYNVYEPNVRAVLGALHIGLGHTQMTNFFATMDIPSMSQPAFKRHERNLIPAIEKVTKDGLEEATQKR